MNASLRAVTPSKPFSSVLNHNPQWLDTAGYLSLGFDDFQAIQREHGNTAFPLHGYYELHEVTDTLTVEQELGLESQPQRTRRPQILPFTVEISCGEIRVIQHLPTAPGSELNERAYVYRDRVRIYRGGSAYRELAQYRDGYERLFWAESGRTTWIDHTNLRLPHNSVPGSCGVIYRYMDARLFNACRGMRLVHTAGDSNNAFQLKQAWDTTWTGNHFHGLAATVNGAHPQSSMKPTVDELKLFENIRADNRQLSEEQVRAYLARTLELAARRTGR